MIPKQKRQYSAPGTTLNAENGGWDVSHHRGTAALILARVQQRYHQNVPLDMALRRPIVSDSPSNYMYAQCSFMLLGSEMHSPWGASPIVASL
jgi:hypothetical protein